MNILHDSDQDIQELIAERDHCLPSIISSFSDVEHNSKLLENIKVCTKYFPTYNVSNIEADLFQHVIPVIKKCLQKAYDDNFLMSDTVDDDFVLNILKENLQIALGFMQIMKTIVEFLSQNNKVNLDNLNSTPTNLAKLILLTFEHCKNSTDMYKTTFSLELLEIFRITQEVHLLFLRLFESYIVIKDDPCNVDEVIVLRQVLEIICSMSEVLSSLNIKSLSDNWKGYTAITQKFSNLLIDTIDLKLPMQSLTSEILKNMNSLENLDETDLKSVPQVIKITGFLIKVALKIYDIFWNCKEKISRELLNFCCTIYSFPPDLYRSQGYPSDISELVESLLFKSIDPFLMRLANDTAFIKIFSSQNLASCEYSFGLINFLNSVLQLLVLNDEKFADLRIDVIIRVIFDNIKLCYTEVFWAANILDSLIVNIAACVMVNDECFAEVEGILLANLLQEDIWSALLSLEVWSLLLSNFTQQMCLETLFSLIRIHQGLDFGLHTNRLEEVYLKCLMQRIFKMLPTYMKIEIARACNPVNNIHTWKMIEFKHFPMQQKFMLEDICTASVDRIESISNGNGSLNDVIFAAERLAVLSTANFNEVGLNSTKLVNAVHSLWEFNTNCIGLISNNLFKYFMVKLCKITSSLMEEFDNKQVITVLTQLKALSTDDFYRLLVCEILVAFCRTSLEYHQEGNKIYTLITNIIYPNLLSTNKGVVKQNVFEVIQNLAISGNHEIVKNIMRISNEMQGQISSYLQRNISSSKFDKEYLELLGSFTFQHECIKWRIDVSQPRLKRPKIDDSVHVDDLTDLKAKQTYENNTEVIRTVPIPKIESFRPGEDKTENISEVLDNIKGEVKCLVNVLKTEKLSKKNASDIKLIANKLLSFL